MLSAVDRVFKGIGKGINWALPENGWVGRLIGETGKDVVDFAKKEAAEAPGFFARLGKKIPLLGRVVDGVKGQYSAFGKIPGIRGLSGFLKVNYFIEAVMDGFKAMKDGVTGYSKTKGGIYTKLMGGIKSGVKSIAKSAGVLGASVLAAVKLPLLLGLEGGAFGPAGILVGLIGGMAAGGLARKGLDMLFDTHGHTQNEGLPKGEINFDLMSQNDVSAAIQSRWDNREKLNPYLRSGKSNPFLNIQ